MKNFFFLQLLTKAIDNNKGNTLIKDKIAIKLALIKTLSCLQKYKAIKAMQTIKISTCPLETIDNTGKLMPTIIKEQGLI